MNTKCLVRVALFFVWMLAVCPTIGWADQDMGSPLKRRQHFIDQALDRADPSARSQSVQEEYIFKVKMPPLSQKPDRVPRKKYPAPLPPERQFRRAPEPDRLLLGRSPIPQPPPSAKPLFKPVRPDDALSEIHPLTAVDFGLELHSFHYEQEKHWPLAYYITYLEPLQVTHDGLLCGAFASYTHRLNHNRPIESLGDIFRNGNGTNFFKVEGSYVTGEVNYDVSVLDESDGYDTWEFDVRGLIGYDIPSQDYSFLITPFFGFGYRGLHIEDAGGWVDYADAFWNYDRDMDYGYLPLGLQVQKDFQKKWRMELSVEYDWVVFGNLTSHFDQPGFIVVGTGAAAGKMLQMEKMENDQDEGYGVRASAKIIKVHEPFDIFVEPFIRYWNINASESSHYHFVDQEGGRYVASGTNVNYEPENTTIECGFRMGLRY